MVFTNVSTKIINPQQPQLFVDSEVIADTGALSTLVPSHLLDSIEVKRRRRQESTTASGQTIVGWMGDASYQHNNYEAAAPVTFGEPGDITILGVATLEALGLEVDLVSKQLRRMPKLLF